MVVQTDNKKKINVLGVENDHNRLYNYAYSLFDSIVKSKNDDKDVVKEKKYAKRIVKRGIIRRE